jgi:hypothetical protein
VGVTGTAGDGVELGLDDLGGRWWPVVRASGGRVASVRLLKVSAGGPEAPAEALLSPGGGGVLVRGLLPALQGDCAGLVKVFEPCLEVTDLVVEAAALGVDEACEPALGVGCGGRGSGQGAAGLVSLDPDAGGRGLFDLREP